MAADGRISVFSVGDVFPDIPDGQASFAPLTPLFAKADIVFGNCEGVYSDHPSRAPSRKHFCGGPRAHGEFLGEVGFDVMSCANNHMIDGGYEGLADTLDVLRSQGIQTTGAGTEIGGGPPAAGLRRRGRRGWPPCSSAPTTAIPTPTPGSRGSIRSSPPCCSPTT